MREWSTITINNHPSNPHSHPFPTKHQEVLFRRPCGSQVHKCWIRVVPERIPNSFPGRRRCFSHSRRIKHGLLDNLPIYFEAAASYVWLPCVGLLYFWMVLQNVTNYISPYIGWISTSDRFRTFLSICGLLHFHHTFYLDTPGALDSNCESGYTMIHYDHSSTSLKITSLW